MPVKVTDMKFPYVGRSDFTSGNTDVLASFREDCTLLPQETF